MEMVQNKDMIGFFQELCIGVHKSLEVLEFMQNMMYPWVEHVIVFTSVM